MSGFATLSSSHIAVSVLAVLASILSPGCCGDPQCEPPLSDEQTPVADASLPAAWTRSDLTTIQVVAAAGPYRVGDFALDRLRVVLAEQAGLSVEITDGIDTGLSASGTVSANELVQAGREQIPPGTDAALVVVVVDDTDEPGATYGFIDCQYTPRLTAVTGLHRRAIQGAAVGPISADMIEAGTLVHEVGHWLGLPARDFHTSAIDAAHCTNARCVMFKGSRITPCAVRANLCTGMPMSFCEDCAAELAEMQRRRQASPVAKRQTGIGDE